MNRRRPLIIGTVIAAIVILLCGGLVAVGITRLAEAVRSRSVWRMEGTSMYPSLRDGQIVEARSVPASDLKRGDVIVFEFNGRTWLKRLIGLPNEHVEIKKGVVFINGSELAEPYINAPGPYSGDWRLGPDEYFVLGDNRPNSSDSHNYGPISGADIKGRVVGVAGQ